MVQTFWRHCGGTASMTTKQLPTPLLNNGVFLPRHAWFIGNLCLQHVNNDQHCFISYKERVLRYTSPVLALFSLHSVSCDMFVISFKPLSGVRSVDVLFVFYHVIVVLYLSIWTRRTWKWFWTNCGGAMKLWSRDLHWYANGLTTYPRSRD